MSHNLRLLWLLASLCFLSTSLHGCGGGSGPTGDIEGYVYVPQSRSAPLVPRVSRASGPPTGYVALVGAQVTVTVGGQSKTAVTDQNGHFVVSGLPTGIAQLHVVDPSGDNAPFDTQLEVQANTMASVGTNGQVSLVSHSASSLDVSIDQIDTTKWPTVTALVSVTDPVRQTPILGLIAGQFQVQVNGNPVTPAITQQSSATARPASIVLIQDCSGSMDGQPFIDAKVSLNAFVGNLSTIDRAELIQFSNDVNVVQPFTSDHALLQGAITKMKIGGATALYDAIKKAEDNLQGEPDSASKAIVVMTDGGENASATDRPTLMTLLQGRQVPVYAIGFGGTDFSRKVEVGRSGKYFANRAAEIDLQDIASTSHGEYFFVANSTDLIGVYTKITARKQQQYALTFTDSADGNRTISLQIAAFGLHETSPATKEYQHLTFGYPFANWPHTITQGFGDGWTDTGVNPPKDYFGHTGVDISAQIGTDVLPIGDGTVTEVKTTDGGATDGWGRYVIVQHDGFGAGTVRCSLYAHLSLVSVTQGQRVERGKTVIGRSGQKGTGPHLHLEIRDKSTDAGYGYTGQKFSAVSITDTRNHITYFDPMKFIASPF